MINQLSKKMTMFFIENKIIQSEEEDVCIYCMELIFSALLNTLVLLIIGLVVGRFFETILFILGFAPMRQIAGGFYAESHKRCFLTFMGIYTLFLLVIMTCPPEMVTILSLWILSISGVIVFICGPIENKNKPYNKYEKEKLKQMSRYLLLGYVFVIVYGMVFFSNNILFFSITLGLFAASLSGLVAWILEIKERKEEND